MGTTLRKFFKRVLHRRTSRIAALFAFLFIGAIYLKSFAFIGPTLPGGTGSGAIGSDNSNNLSFGTSTTSNTTKLLIVASSTNSGEYAFRIVQPGTGPIFVVRNDGNIGIGTSTPASTLTVNGNIYSTGSFSGTISAGNVSSGAFGANTGGGNYSFPANVGIGTTAGTNLVDIASANVNSRFQTNTYYANDTGGFLFRLQKSRGTTVGAHTIVQSGDILGRVQGLGSNGTSFDTAADIAFAVDGTPGSSADMPGRIVFSTSLDGAASVTERMRIDNAGNVGIGLSPAFNFQVHTGTNHNFSINDNANAVHVFSYNDAVSAYSDLSFGFAANQLYLPAGGSVGIGTTNPTSTLTVVGEIKSTSGGVRFPDGTLQTTAGGGSISGSGTTNSIPLWTGSTALGNSAITQPTSTTIALGSAGLAVGTTTTQTTGNGYFTGTVTATTFLGTHSAASVSSGSFGANTGGGNYTFPASLTVNGTLYGAGSTATYGAITIDGSKGGWSGINFKAAGVNQKTLMIHPSYSGVYNNTDNGWDWYWTNGTLSVGTVPAANISAGTFGSGAYTFTGGNVNFPGSGIWNSSGNVGIGTASPIYNLQVSASLGTAFALEDTSVASATYGRNWRFLNTSGVLTIRPTTGTDGGSGQANLTLDNNSNVGIAITPTARLDVHSYGAGTGLTFRTSNGSGSDTVDILDNGNVGIGTTSPLSILHTSTNAAEGRNFVDSYAGNFGPGFLLRSARGTAASPTALLNGSYLFYIGGRGYNGSAFSSSQTSIYSTAAEGWSTTAEGTNLFFGTTPNGSTTIQTRLFIGQDGRVGVGNSNPGAPLEVRGATAGLISGNAYSMGSFVDQATSKGVMIGYDSSSATGVIAPTAGASVANNLAFWNYNPTAGWRETMRLDSAGNLGIGMSPSYQLQLSLDSAAKPNGGSWTNPSDIRLKDNVRPFTDGLTALLGVTPKQWEYNGKGGSVAGSHGIGFVAQDVKNVLPGVGTYQAKLNPTDATDTTLYDFNPSALNFIEINAIKELNAKVDSQQKEIDELKAQIHSLKGGESNAAPARMISAQSAAPSVIDRIVSALISLTFPFRAMLALASS